ncbi:hypothetical protein I2F27_04875 [Acinetobacter sp. B5B]|uniref:hypothetical protein n=1 Tax=Acinetobacter baretiae TaxID=2605383 RepID=UPI0018C2C438|nr:hypothetical protein [Acinetobacter baretiae]MBF7682667.1 hypothetical protein [Acinetobacter baretiae]MBF7685651.1 hypothetical protein [Acinetobacter baretiae]
MSDEKKSSHSGWIGVGIAFVFAIFFLGFLFLSVQQDTTKVNNYAKTWSGDGASDPMASMPMGHEGMNHGKHGHGQH